MRQPRVRSATDSLYWSARWRRFRLLFLADPANAVCAMCRSAGRIVPSEVVDHVQALRGDASRFWDGPFQALCRGCHDSRKKAQDARGYDTAVGLDGFPLDEAHPFYTGKLRRSPR